VHRPSKGGLVLTTKDRRAVLLGGAVIAAAVLALRIVPWTARTLYGAHSDLSERAALLARSHHELSQVRALEDSAAALTATLQGLAARLLDGSSSAEAGADLAARLSLAASGAPARVVSVDQMVDSTRAGTLQRVSARASLETDVRGLAAVLRAVEFGDAPLTVERLSIVSPNPGSGERVAETLAVELTITGWFLAR
jgi:hypothetical protein